MGKVYIAKRIVIEQLWNQYTPHYSIKILDITDVKDSIRTAAYVRCRSIGRVLIEESAFPKPLF